MMIHYLIPILLAFDLYSAQEGKKSLIDEDYKSEINSIQKSIQIASHDQISSLQKELAILHFKDQELERAFIAFLQALEAIKIETAPIVTEEEKVLYEKGLQIYLNAHGPSEASEGAEMILEQFQSILIVHPDYFLLSFLIAVSEANLDQFESFFHRFYQAYRFFPQHYMAYKTKTILHTKLFAMAKTPAEKEFRRGEIVKNAALAVEKNAHDIALYKILINFAQENQKKKVLNSCLNKIIDQNIIIPRTEIAFYVEQAVEADQRDLAQSFLNKARSWYPQSRTIETLSAQLK